MTVINHDIGLPAPVERLLIKSDMYGFEVGLCIANPAISVFVGS